MTRAARPLSTAARVFVALGLVAGAWGALSATGCSEPCQDLAERCAHCPNQTYRVSCEQLVADGVDSVCSEQLPTFVQICPDPPEGGGQTSGQGASGGATGASGGASPGGTSGVGGAGGNGGTGGGGGVGTVGGAGGLGGPGAVGGAGGLGGSGAVGGGGAVGGVGGAGG